jgi:hypothetical protein
MSIDRILENLEITDVDEFLADCQQEADKLGITLEYYLEEFL